MSASSSVQTRVDARVAPAQMSGHQRHVLRSGHVREEPAFLQRRSRGRGGSNWRYACGDRLRPATMTRPDCGHSSAAASRSTVDLPHPLGPTSAVVRPASSANDKRIERELPAQTQRHFFECEHGSHRCLACGPTILTCQSALHRAQHGRVSNCETCDPAQKLGRMAPKPIIVSRARRGRRAGCRRAAPATPRAPWPCPRRLSAPRRCDGLAVCREHDVARADSGLFRGTLDLLDHQTVLDLGVRASPRPRASRTASPRRPPCASPADAAIDCAVGVLAERSVEVALRLVAPDLQPAHSCRGRPRPRSAGSAPAESTGRPSKLRMTSPASMPALRGRAVVLDGGDQRAARRVEPEESRRAPGRRPGCRRRACRA